MVCSIGSGRMAAMARLLAAERVSQTTTEDVGHHKLAVQYIYRELREADESNLLDEEDMLVFGLKPVTDPLHLVCCNTCKKPLKASQYVAHAELCKSLSLVEETVLELDGGTGYKKPPRKEKKKLSTIQATLVGGRERLEPTGLHGTTSLNSRMLEQKPLTSSLPTEAKDGAFVTDGSDISPAHTDNSASALLPPTKRSKMISAESLLTPDQLETANGVNKSLCISTQEAFTCGGEYLNGSRARNERTCDRVFRFHMPTEVHDCFLPTKEFPNPLATKIYYSQTSHRLRSVISNLYKASFNEHSDELLIPSGLEENAAVPRTSSSRNISHEQFDGQQEKRDTSWVPSMQTPNQLLAQSADVCMDKSGGCSSFPLNNVLGSPTPPVGMLRQKSQNYLSIPYSFMGNSEKPLDTMQLPKGSVPVI